MAEGQRIISSRSRNRRKSMFPKNSGVGQLGPDHLTFDLADESKLSLSSFYGKRPEAWLPARQDVDAVLGRGTDTSNDVLEA
ncbi:MAG: hypothetical protein R2710_07910 [Acidimicrobiales bacterium]